MIKKTLLLSLINFTFLLASMAQNQFNMSQYMLHHGFVNPAAIGNQDVVNAALFHRSQWLGLSGAPTSQGLNVNLPFKAAKHTLGMTLLHDEVGANNNTGITLGYAFKARLTTKINLLIGLGATIDVLKSNYSSLYINDASDPTFNSNSTSVLPNFKYGMYLTYGKFYGGLAIPNLLKNKIVTNGKGQTSFDYKNLHYYLQAGYLFTLNTKTQLGASTLIKQVGGSPLQTDLNVEFIFSEKLGIGASYRTSKEIVGLINYQITPMFRLGYSYDFGFSQLRNYNTGSHEVVLIFTNITNKKAIGAQVPRF